MGGCLAWRDRGLGGKRVSRGLDLQHKALRWVYKCREGCLDKGHVAVGGKRVKR